MHTMNESPAPPKARVVLFRTGTKIEIYDGCVTSVRTSGALSTEGFLPAKPFRTTKRACTDIGYTYDVRLSGLLAHDLIFERVGDDLVIRTPDLWVTLRRKPAPTG